MAETQATQKKSGNRHKKWPRRAKGGEGKACGVQGCKRPYRAKGYCYFHYKKWRQGELPHTRYRICSKAECRKKASRHGLCEQHWSDKYKKAEAPAAAAAPAAAPAA